MHQALTFIYKVSLIFSVAMLLLTPNAHSRPLEYIDIFPLDLPALEQKADERYEYFLSIIYTIKDSGRYQWEWFMAEYALEEARISNASRALCKKPSAVRCLRQQGKTWTEIFMSRIMKPDAINLYSESEFGYVRDFEYLLWRCYYSPNTYALRKMNERFWWHEPLTSKEIAALILSDPCLEQANLENDLKLFPVKKPNWWYTLPLSKESTVNLALYCPTYNNTVSTARYLAIAQSPCAQTVNTLSQSIPCGKILNYVPMDNSDDIKVQYRAYKEMFDLTNPWPGRFNLCE